MCLSTVKKNAAPRFLGTCLSDGRLANTSWSPHSVHRQGWVGGFGHPICDISDILFPSTREAAAIVMVLSIKCSSWVRGIIEDIPSTALTNISPAETKLLTRSAVLVRDVRDIGSRLRDEATIPHCEVTGIGRYGHGGSETDRHR